MQMTPEQLDVLVVQHHKPTTEEILWKAARAMAVVVSVAVILWFALSVFVVLQLR